NGANLASVAAQASIVFLDKVREGETLVAEATEVAREGRAGVTCVAVRTNEDRAIAEFTGYSRTLGGPVVQICTLSPSGLHRSHVHDRATEDVQDRKSRGPPAPRGVRGAGG